MTGEIGKIAAGQGMAEKAAALGASRDGLQRKQAAQEFASLLFVEVLKAMRATLSQTGFSENESLSRDIYSAMMDAEIARVMARRDSTGLSRMVEQSLDGARPQPAQASPIRGPAQGVISSTFGARKDPLTGSLRFHHGVDIAAPGGTPIEPVAPGKVVFSGRKAGYGNLVEIDHGAGFMTRYAHNAANLVAAGAEVAPGQAIALVGSTGRSTGSHLHFEARRHGRAIDPENMLSQLTKGMNLKTKV